MTFADNPTINFTYSDNFSSCTCKENFISNIYIMHSERFFLNFVTLIVANFDDSLTCNTVKSTQVAWRCSDYAIFHDKNVVTRAFRNITLSIHHNRFTRSSEVGLNFYQNIIQIVQRLDLWI
ncbi:hypothetical protein D3C73_979110 [compost metagenome]